MKYTSALITTMRLFSKYNLLKLTLPRIRLEQQSLHTTAAVDTNVAEENISGVSGTFAKEWEAAKSFEEIPSLSRWAFIRNFLPGGRYAKLDMTQLIMAWREDMGSVARIKGIFGRPDAVFTHNAEDFEKTLRHEGIWPIRPGTDGIAYHRTVHRAEFFKGVEGLITTSGEKWSSFRSVVNPILMNPKNVRFYMPKMSHVNQQFVERIRHIRDSASFEVTATFEEELNRWSFESLCVVALDKHLGLLAADSQHNDDAKALFRHLTDFFTYGVDVEFKPPIWKIYKTKAFRQFMTALDGIMTITHKYVEEAIQCLEDDQMRGVVEKPENDKSVLEKLIKTDRKIATVMAMDMLMAGVDATSSVAAAILLCLSQNPDKQSKLREEIMQVLPNNVGEFDENRFKNMPYLRAFIKESLRVYPLLFGNNRISTCDMVLSGYRVPKGTHIAMVNLSLLQDDNHYPRADEFLPERWLRTPKDVGASSECPFKLKASSPFIYLPFGFGPRTCVGRRIVEMELELLIARLVRNFQIEFNYPTDNLFKSVLINVPNVPLKFKFTDID